MRLTASDRARSRLREEIAKQHLNQTDIAGRLQWTQSRVSKLLNGRTELGLDDLEQMCFAVGLAMTEVVRDHGLEFCAEMTPSELRFLERVRQLTAIERDSLMTFIGIASKTRRESRSASAQKDIIPRGRS